MRVRSRQNFKMFQLVFQRLLVLLLDIGEVMEHSQVVLVEALKLVQDVLIMLFDYLIVIKSQRLLKAMLLNL